MITTLATCLSLGCIGIVLTCLLRHPARRLTGPGPAFCLWLLPPLLAASAWLPAWHGLGDAMSLASWLPSMSVTPGTTVAQTHDPDPLQLLSWLWLAGSGLMLARLVWHGTRLLRQSRHLPTAMAEALAPELDHLDPHQVRVHPAGPAVCWLPRCRLLLPADLLQRFDARERAQVLAHERMHLARHDPLWSLLAELCLAAWWFFPPAWLAIARFRLDQELACDAALLASRPGHAGAYARALLTSATGPQAPTLATAWLSGHQLKERLRMIHQPPRTLLKGRAGYATLAAMLAIMTASAHAAWPGASATASPAPASPAVATTTAPTTNVPWRNNHPPRYPQKAIDNKEEGTVILMALIGTDGNVLKLEYDHDATRASQSLIDAAMAAARQWRFNPGMVNGKPVKGWARVPVTFYMPKLHKGKTEPEKP